MSSLNIEVRAAFDLLLIAADNAARALDSGLTADEAIAAIEAGLDANLNGTDPEPTAPAPVAVAPVSAPREGETVAAPVAAPTMDNGKAARAARIRARRSVRVAPAALGAAAPEMVPAGGFVGPHEPGTAGWRAWCGVQYANALGDICRMVCEGAGPGAVAAFVLSLGVIGGSVSRSIEDKAYPGTFAEAVFDILAN